MLVLTSPSRRSRRQPSGDALVAEGGFDFTFPAESPTTKLAEAREIEEF